MKLLAILLLVTTSAFAQVRAITGQIHRTVVTAGTPLQVSATNLEVKMACFQCSFANTGTSCYVGNSSANAVAARAIAMSRLTATVPAQPVCFGDMNNGSGPKLNLNAFFVDVATSNDEVNVFYIE